MLGDGVSTTCTSTSGGCRHPSSFRKAWTKPEAQTAWEAAIVALIKEARTDGASSRQTAEVQSTCHISIFLSDSLISLIPEDN